MEGRPDDPHRKNLIVANAESSSPFVMRWVQSCGAEIGDDGGDEPGKLLRKRSPEQMVIVNGWKMEARLLIPGAHVSEANSDQRRQRHARRRIDDLAAELSLLGIEFLQPSNYLFVRHLCQARLLIQPNGGRK